MVKNSRLKYVRKKIERQPLSIFALIYHSSDEDGWTMNHSDTLINKFFGREAL